MSKEKLWGCTCALSGGRMMCPIEAVVKDKNELIKSYYLFFCITISRCTVLEIGSRLLGSFYNDA